MGYRARSAIGSQWSIPLRLIDGRPMPPLPPTATSCVGGPNGQSYGYRDCIGIASGLTREWFGEVGEKWKNPPGPLSKGVTIEKDCDLLKNAQTPTIKLIF